MDGLGVVVSNDGYLSMVWFVFDGVGYCFDYRFVFLMGYVDCFVVGVVDY